MRIPGLSKSRSLSFKEIEDFSGKIKECAWAFQQAIECLISKKCESFEELRQDVTRLVSEVGLKGEQIATGVALSGKLPAPGHLILSFLRELTRVTASVEEALEWFSFRKEPVIPQELEKDFFLLFDSVVDPIEELVKIVAEAGKYFKKPGDKQKKVVLSLIAGLSKLSGEANRLDERVKRKIFAQIDDPLAVFHLVRLSDIVTSIGGRAENTGDLLRVMLCKP